MGVYYFAEKCLKKVIFRVQIEGWAFIGEWFIRDFTVPVFVSEVSIILIQDRLHYYRIKYLRLIFFV